jgi:hypothetical protein
VVMDAQQRPFSELIGNGSLVNIKVGLMEYDNQYGKGVTKALQAVQVLAHVPYEPSSIAEGFDLIEADEESDEF